jgi:hypothetical protein
MYLVRDEGIELRHFGCRDNDIEIGLEATRHVELIEENVILGQCMLSFKIPMSGFCFADDGAMSPLVVGKDVGSLVFLISVSIVMERARDGILATTVNSEDPKTPFSEDLEEFIDKCCVFFGIRPEMHGRFRPCLRRDFYLAGVSIPSRTLS